MANTSIVATDIEPEEKGFFGQTWDLFGGQVDRLMNSEPVVEAGNTAKELGNEYILAPVQEQANKLQEVAPTAAGRGLVSVTSLGLDIASNYTDNQFVHLAAEGAGIMTGSEANPFAGIETKDVAERVEMIDTALDRLGIPEMMGESQNQYDSVIGLLGKRKSGVEDARNLMGLLEGTGIDTFNGFAGQRQLIKALPADLKEAVGRGLDVVDSKNNIVSLLAAYDGADDAQKAVIEMDIAANVDMIGLQLVKLSETLDSFEEGLIPRLREFTEEKVGPLNLVKKTAQGQVRDFMVNNEDAVAFMETGTSSSVLKFAGASLTDDTPMMASALKEIGDADLENLLRGPDMSANPLLNTPEEMAKFEAQKALLGEILDGVVTLTTSKDKTEIEQVGRSLATQLAQQTGQGGMLEGQVPDLSNSAAPIADVAGNLVSGGDMKDTRGALGNVVGTEAIDMIAENPILMSLMIMGTTGGLGMIGNKTMGGMGGLLLPMLAPMLLTGLMGDDFKAGRENMIDHYRGIGKDVIGMLPENVRDKPMVGGMLNMMAENPLTAMMIMGGVGGMFNMPGSSAMSEIGGLSTLGGMGLASMVFAQSAMRDDAQVEGTTSTGQVTNPTTVTAPSIPVTGDTQPAPSGQASSGVGNITAAADTATNLGVEVTSARNKALMTH